MRPAEKLIIFLKAPQVGKVKSRLAEELGEAEALSAYLQMTRQLFRQLESWPEVEIHFTPAGAEMEVKSIPTPVNWRLIPQFEGDLGRKLDYAFESSFAEGRSRVVIIGSDCPYVESSDITQAFERLREVPLVLGPAEDGGYWLIGLSKPAPELFEGMPWSSSQLLRETREKAKELSLAHEELRKLSDIDLLEDWNEFREFQQLSIPL